MSLKIGDIVARKSYGSDILFKVVDIKYEKGNKIVILKGICYRLEADAPETDLVVQSDTCVREYNARVNRSVKEKIRSLNESLMRDKSKKNSFVTSLKRIMRTFQSLVRCFILMGTVITLILVWRSTGS
ncbi:sporulation-specific protease YabG [Acetivibrio straminisolvens JCM 21531]|uniref:Sporulation-specific protease YabG n=1 Tax=Acetivibrio straminisolvens JCM 21531 TaxID=1294263 RepID=W4VCI9_9FIRM|nr:sporulation-specific protease YabG [Acetivibrio straminisolvens JCM 21531]